MSTLHNALVDSRGYSVSAPTYESTDKRTSYRGRKMRPGRYVAGPPRVFISYCDHCHEKVLLPVEQVALFGRYFKRESKSLKYKLYKYFADKLS